MSAGGGSYARRESRNPERELRKKLTRRSPVNAAFTVTRHAARQNAALASNFTIGSIEAVSITINRRSRVGVGAMLTFAILGLVLAALFVAPLFGRERPVSP